MAKDNDTLTCPECGHQFEDEDLTTSVKERWEYTGTVLASLIIVSLSVLILAAGFGFVALSPITQGWWALYGTVVLMAATWTFGEGTLKAVKKARGN